MNGPLSAETVIYARTKVRVVDAIERSIYDVSLYIGRLGIVLGYVGFADMLDVKFTDGSCESFWPEELQVLS